MADLGLPHPIVNGILAGLLLGSLLVGGGIYMDSTRPTTHWNPNMACRQHEGVKQVFGYKSYVDGAVCNDGVYRAWGEGGYTR